MSSSALTTPTNMVYCNAFCHARNLKLEDIKLHRFEYSVILSTMIWSQELLHRPNKWCWKYSWWWLVQMQWWTNDNFWFSISGSCHRFVIFCGRTWKSLFTSFSTSYSIECRLAARKKRHIHQQRLPLGQASLPIQYNM